LRYPVLNAHLIAGELGLFANNVYRYIEPFENAGIMLEFTDPQRNRTWRSTEILASLDAFAARASKRGLSN
jgi:hypothetical protein